MTEKKLVKHVRVPHYKFNKDTLNVSVEWHPIATIVALNPNQIGVAVCHKKDRFSKRRGREIAEGRALLGKDTYDCDNRKFNYFENNQIVSYSLNEIIDNEILNMQFRAEKYFNPPKVKPAKKKEFLRSMIRPWAGKK